MTAEETKKWKAKNFRYKKPIAKNLNFHEIRRELMEIGDACYDVRYYLECDEDTLINALDGDEDDAYEFRMMFADLDAECDQMWSDLGEAFVSEYFDLFFVAMNDHGVMLGYDTYEHDYYGLDRIESEWANKEAIKKMKTLTKDQLIKTARFCLNVYQSYIGLRYRYDCIKTAMDILRDQNTGYLQMVTQIEELYEKANEETNGFKRDPYPRQDLDMFERLLDNMPQEAWIQ